MNFNDASDKPLFQQVAEQIREGILNGTFKEEEQIPSTTEISKAYHINPATVLKGMNLLVEQELIEKKRGIGMFVRQGAQKKIMAHKKEEFLTKDVLLLIQEAKKLGITSQELLDLIERGYHS